MSWSIFVIHLAFGGNNLDNFVINSYATRSLCELGRVSIARRGDHSFFLSNGQTVRFPFSSTKCVKDDLR